MMNALGHERFCVAGHDIGMWIGFAMAADHADRVKQLAVADAMIPGVTPSPQLFGPAARNNRSWHFAFNRAPDEIQQALLSKGGARAYLEWQFKTKAAFRSEEHTSELQSLMRISYAVFCLKKKTQYKQQIMHTTQ